MTSCNLHAFTSRQLQLHFHGAWYEHAVDYVQHAAPGSDVRKSYHSGTMRRGYDVHARSRADVQGLRAQLRSQLKRFFARRPRAGLRSCVQ